MTYEEETIRADQDERMNNYLAAVREAIRSLEECKPIVKANAGKVYNKNIKEAFSKREQERDSSRYVYMSTWSSCPNKPWLHIQAGYTFKTYRDYTEHARYEIEVSLVLTEPEGNARPRLDAAGTLAKINEQIETMKKELSEIIQARAGLDMYFQKIEEASKLMSEASAAIRGQDCHYGTNIFSKVYETTYTISKYRR